MGLCLKSQQRFKSDHDSAYTKEVNKIVLSSNNNKRLKEHLKESQHVHMKQMFLKYMKVKS